MKTKVVEASFPIVVAALLTTDQAAAFLNVRPQTLAIWRCTGRYDLPFVRVGRRIMYRRDTLENWLAARTGTSTAAITAAIN